MTSDELNAGLIQSLVTSINALNSTVGELRGSKVDHSDFVELERKLTTAITTGFDSVRRDMQEESDKSRRERDRLNDEVLILKTNQAQLIRDSHKSLALLTGNGTPGVLDEIARIEQDIDHKYNNHQRELDAIKQRRKLSASIFETTSKALKSLPDVLPALVGGIGSITAFFDPAILYLRGWSFEESLLRAGSILAVSLFVTLVLLINKRGNDNGEGRHSHANPAG